MRSAHRATPVFLEVLRPADGRGQEPHFVRLVEHGPVAEIELGQPYAIDGHLFHDTALDEGVAVVRAVADLPGSELPLVLHVHDERDGEHERAASAVLTPVTLLAGEAAP